MKLASKLLCLCLLLAPNLQSAAQLPPARVAFRHYGVSEGLRNLSGECLLQDRQGFLWVGTQGGAFRYDGQRFQEFSDRQGLGGGEIHAIHEDPAGTLWVGTFAGLYRKNGNRFEAVASIKGRVEHIQTGPEGRIWVTTSEGPYRQEADGSFAPVPGWPGGEVTAIAASQDRGLFWVACSQPGAGAPKISVFSWRAGIWDLRQKATQTFRGERIDALAVGPRGEVWARSSQRLWMRAPDRADFQEVSIPAFPTTQRGTLSLDRQGNLWVPFNNGLLRHDGTQWDILGSAAGFPEENTRAVLLDREGSLWVAGVGVYRQLGRNIITSYTRSEGLPGNVIWRIYRDSQGILWLATDKGVARARNGRWEMLEAAGRNMIRSFTEDRQGRIYIAGHPQQVMRCRLDGSGMERIPIASDRTPKRVFQALVDPEGTLWLATENAGLLKCNTRDPRPTFQVENLPEGTPGERFSDLALDGEGRLWASGIQGLAMRENGKWIRLTTAHGLHSNTLAYARPTRSGDLLIGYYGGAGVGIFRWDGHRLEPLRHLTVDNGLASNHIYFVGEDILGGLWIGSGAGVDRILDDAVEHMGSTEGLPSDDCNAMAFLAEPNGDVWVGTSGGLARIQLNLHPGPLAPPPTVFLSVHSGSRELSTTSPLSSPIPYEENTLVADFAGLSFAAEAQVEHQVRLVGLEETWHATTQHEARYPALPHGDYRLEVRSRIAPGSWGEPAAFSFAVDAPWWQTPWFIALAVMAMGGCIYGFIRIRVATLHRHNRELEAIVASRTLELKEANEALRNQSITDPLTGLRNRRFLGSSLPSDIAQVNRTHRSLKLGLHERVSANVDILFLMVDLDHFKTINDDYGHHAGDLMLQQVAEILKQAIRDSDTVVRWGGEEFLVVCRNACRKESTVVAERIRSLLSQHVFDLGEGRQTHRTCSLGYAYYPLSLGVPELFSWEQVVDLADQCLYAAKRAGRDAFVGISMTDETRLLPFHRSGFVPMERLVEEGVVVVEHSLTIGDNLDWKFTPH